MKVAASFSLLFLELSPRSIIFEEEKEKRNMKTKMLSNEQFVLAMPAAPFLFFFSLFSQNFPLNKLSKDENVKTKMLSNEQFALAMPAAACPFTSNSCFAISMHPNIQHLLHLQTPLQFPNVIIAILETFPQCVDAIGMRNMTLRFEQTTVSGS